MCTVLSARNEMADQTGVIPAPGELTAGRTSVELGLLNWKWREVMFALRFED